MVTKNKNFAAQHSSSEVKIRSLKKNSVVYFLVDIADREFETRPEQESSTARVMQ